MTFSGATNIHRIKIMRPSLLTCWILGAMLCASPAWGADGVCQFRAKGLSLVFGNLDPSSNAVVPKPVVAETTFANMAGDCQGGTMTVRIQDGSTSRLLRKGADTIAYTLAGLPVTMARPGNAPPGNPGNGFTTWMGAGAVTGTIQWTAYANAPAGDYTDAVTIEVTP